MFNNCEKKKIRKIVVIFAEDEEVAFINAVDSTPRYEDHLSGPLPSALPSPELRPNANIPDLMKFEKQPGNS